MKGMPKIQRILYITLSNFQIFDNSQFEYLSKHGGCFIIQARYGDQVKYSDPIKIQNQTNNSKNKVIIQQYSECRMCIDVFLPIKQCPPPHSIEFSLLNSLYEKVSFLEQISSLHLLSALPNQPHQIVFVRNESQPILKANISFQYQLDHQSNNINTTRSFSKGLFIQGMSKIVQQAMNFCGFAKEKQKQKVFYQSYFSQFKSRLIILGKDEDQFCLHFPFHSEVLSTNSLPADTYLFGYSIACSLPNGKMLITGGINSLLNTIVSQCLIFDTLQDRVHVVDEMLQARYTHTMVYCDGFAYVLGGRYYGKEADGVLSECERYDCRRNRWEVIASLQQRRCTAAATYYKSHIYIFGGYSGTSRIDTIEKYDMNYDSWEILQGITLIRPIEAGCAFLLADYLFNPKLTLFSLQDKHNIPYQEYDADEQLFKSNFESQFLFISGKDEVKENPEIYQYDLNPIAQSNQIDDDDIDDDEEEEDKKNSHYKQPVKHEKLSKGRILPRHAMHKNKIYLFGGNGKTWEKLQIKAVAEEEINLNQEIKISVEHCEFKPNHAYPITEQYNASFEEIHNNEMKNYSCATFQENGLQKKYNFSNNIIILRELVDEDNKNNSGFTMYIYDTVSQKMTQQIKTKDILLDEDHELQFNRNQSSIILYNGYLFFCGGRKNIVMNKQNISIIVQKQTQILNIYVAFSSNKSQTLQYNHFNCKPMHIAREKAQICTFRSFVYVFGGFGDYCQCLKSVERFVVDQNKWEIMQDMPVSNVVYSDLENKDQNLQIFETQPYVFNNCAFLVFPKQIILNQDKWLIIQKYDFYGNFWSIYRIRIAIKQFLKKIIFHEDKIILYENAESIQCFPLESDEYIMIVSQQDFNQIIEQPNTLCENAQQQCQQPSHNNQNQNTRYLKSNLIFDFDQYIFSQFYQTALKQFYINLKPISITQQFKTDQFLKFIKQIEDNILAIYQSLSLNQNDGSIILITQTLASNDRSLGFIDYLTYEKQSLCQSQQKMLIFANSDAPSQNGTTNDKISRIIEFDPQSKSESFNEINLLNSNLDQFNSEMKLFNFGQAVGLYDGTIMLTGGVHISGQIADVTSRCLIFYPVGNYFKIAPSMKQQRFSHSMAILKGNVLMVCGGKSLYSTSPADITASTEIFQESQTSSQPSTWVKMQDMKSKRFNHSSIGIGRLIYIFGGKNMHSILTDDIMMFDYQNNLWHEVPACRMVKRLEGVSVVQFSFNQILLLGGQSCDEADNKLQQNDMIQVFYPFTSQITLLRNSTLLQKRSFAYNILHNDELYVIGGDCSHTAEKISLSLDFDQNQNQKFKQQFISGHENLIQDKFGNASVSACNKIWLDKLKLDFEYFREDSNFKSLYIFGIDKFPFIFQLCLDKPPPYNWRKFSKAQIPEQLQFWDYMVAITLPNGSIFLTGGIDNAVSSIKKTTQLLTFTSKCKDGLQQDQDQEQDKNQNQELSQLLLQDTQQKQQQQNAVFKCEQLEDMHKERYTHAICYLNNYIYVIGGRQYGQGVAGVMRECERYNLKIQRCTAAAVSYMNKVYVFGGYRGDGRNKGIERYNEILDIWESVPMVLKFAIEAQVVLKISSSQILMMGGKDHYKEQNFVTLYDLDKMSCYNLEDSQLINSRILAKSAFYDNKLFIVGGHSDQDGEYCQLGQFPLKWQKIESYQSLMPANSTNPNLTKSAHAQSF